MTYRYEAHDDKALPRKGKLEAATIEEAVQKLRDKGLYALRIEKDSEIPMKTVLPDQKAVRPEGVPDSSVSAKSDSRRASEALRSESDLALTALRRASEALRSFSVLIQNTRDKPEGVSPAIWKMAGEVDHHALVKGVIEAALVDAARNLS